MDASRRSDPAVPHPRTPAPRRRPVALAAALLALGLALPAGADIVHLKSGGRVEGRIVAETDAEVRIQLRGGGEVAIARADIESIERIELPEDEYARRRDELRDAGAAEWVDLARWAEAQRMTAETVDCWREAARRDGATDDTRREFARRVEEYGEARRREADRARDRSAEYRRLLTDLCTHAAEATDAPDAMIELARLCEADPDDVDADAWYRAALDARPGWADAWAGLERLYARRGRWRTVADLLDESGRDEARRQAAEEAAAIDRDGAPTPAQLERLAEIARAFDAPEEALRAEERLLEVDPSRRDAALRVAEAYAAAGEWRRALHALDRDDAAEERAAMEWRARYAGVLDAPDVAALSRIEPLVDEYFEADETRRREIAAALAPEPRDLVEAAVRRGRRHGAADATGGPLTYTVHVNPGDYDLEYTAYVPPTYDPRIPTPLLISLHGAQGTGPNHYWFWAPTFERRQDAILVAPTAARYGWGSSTPGHAAVLRVREDAMRRWNVDASRVYLDGASMGGNGTFEVASRYPGLFAALAPRVGAPIRLQITNPATGQADVLIRFVENLTATPTFYVVGARDDRISIDYCRNGRRRMEEVGVPLIYHEHADGGHEWYPEEDAEAIEWMMAQRLALYPADFKFLTDEEPFQRGYWVEIVEHEGRHAIDFNHGDREGVTVETRPAYRPDASFEARFDRERNEIRIEAEGIRRLRVYLHDRMVDFGRDVSIHVGGRRVFRDRVAPSVEFLLEEARRTGDRERLFWAAVDVRARR